MYCYYIHLLHEKNEVDSFSDLPKITHLVNGRTCIQIFFSLTSESRLCSSKNNFSLSAFSSHPESLASHKAFTVKLQSEIFVSQGFFFFDITLTWPSSHLTSSSFSLCIADNSLSHLHIKCWRGPKLSLWTSSIFYQPLLPWFSYSVACL